MDRALIERHLSQAEQHVLDGRGHVARQRRLIARLRRDGHDLGEAQDLLRILEETLASHIADRDRLRQELEDAS
jgi:hypothetical protein